MKCILFWLVLVSAMVSSAITAEVHIHIPGRPAIHCPKAEVRFLNGNETMVEVTTPWGEVYTTHMANVVIVRRDK